VVDEEDGDDSIGEIFREAREQRAAEDARRGTPSRGRGGPGGDRARPRREGSGDGKGADGRPRRRSSGPKRETAVAGSAAGEVATQVVAPAGIAASTPAAEDASKSPRKRRRRRGGRKLEGGNAGAPAAAAEIGRAAC